MKIRFGVHLATHGLYNYQTLLQTTILADQLGYEYITIGDHFFLSPEFHMRVGDVPGKPHKLEAWVTLAALAAKTKRAKLGTRVSPLPFYLPSRLAKMVTTVDIISGGRAILGVGAAVHKNEAIAYGIGWWKHRERIERMTEGLEIILKLWTEDRATFEGKYYNVVDAPFWPKPVQKPHPPIWFGGSGDSLINATVQYGDGIFPFPNMSIDQLKDVKRRLKKAEEQYSREQPILLGPSLSYPDGVGTTPNQWFKKISELAKINAYVVLIDLSLRPVPPEKAQKFLEDFAGKFI